MRSSNVRISVWHTCESEMHEKIELGDNKLVLNGECGRFLRFEMIIVARYPKWVGSMGEGALCVRVQKVTLAMLPSAYLR
jgi:hypothetical protein